jgi:hypothetical protein
MSVSRVIAKQAGLLINLDASHSRVQKILRTSEEISLKPGTAAMHSETLQKPHKRILESPRVAEAFNHASARGVTALAHSI